MGIRKRKSGSRRRTPKEKSKQGERLRRLTEETRTLLAELGSLREQATAFHDRDFPAFNAWVAENLADERAELTRLVRDAEFEEELLALARTAVFNGEARSMAGAIRDLRPRMEMAWSQAAEMDEREAEPADPFDFADDEEEDEEGMADPTDGSRRPKGNPLPDELIDVLFAGFMREIRGVEADEMEEEEFRKAREEFGASFAGADPADPEGFLTRLVRVGATEQDHAQVKGVYRRLVKLLHPDHQGDLSESERELWNEATRARQALDAHTLEGIEIRVHLERGLEIPPTLASPLARFRHSLEEEIAELGAEVEDLWDHPAWNFTRKRLTKSRFNELRRGMLDALDEARHRLRTIRMVVTNLTRTAPRRRKAKRKARKTAATRTARPNVKNTKPPATPAEATEQPRGKPPSTSTATQTPSESTEPERQPHPKRRQKGKKPIGPHQQEFPF